LKASNLIKSSVPCEKLIQYNPYTSPSSWHDEKELQKALDLSFRSTISSIEKMKVIVTTSSSNTNNKTKTKSESKNNLDNKTNEKVYV
jgi:hypothetical protein